MPSRFPDFFGPSTGDQLLAGADLAKITLARWPVDTEDRHVECEFELRGRIPLTGDEASALLADLVATFRAPPAKGGAK